MSTDTSGGRVARSNLTIVTRNTARGKLAYTGGAAINSARIGIVTVGEINMDDDGEDTNSSHRKDHRRPAPGRKLHHHMSF